MKTIARRLHDRQDPLNEIISLAQENGVQAGVILSAVGSLKTSQIRVTVIDRNVRYIPY